MCLTAPCLLPVLWMFLNAAMQKTLSSLGVFQNWKYFVLLAASEIWGEFLSLPGHQKALHKQLVQGRGLWHLGVSQVLSEVELLITPLSLCSKLKQHILWNYLEFVGIAHSKIKRARPNSDANNCCQSSCRFHRIEVKVCQEVLCGPPNGKQVWNPSRITGRIPRSLVSRTLLQNGSDEFMFLL